MSRNFKNRIVSLIVTTLILMVILYLIFFLKYIDISVILAIYLPIWIIGVIAALLGKVVFANVTIIFAGIGLISEYLVHTYNKSHPNMSGALLNTLILLVGVILGVVLQILSTRKTKSNVNNR
ncbi:MAG: hypothetical protein ACOYEJ_00335 [Mahellales bacterium]